MTRTDYRIPPRDDENFGDRLEREAAEEFLSGRLTLPEKPDPETIARASARLEAEIAGAEREDDPLISTSVRLHRSMIDALESYARERGVKPGTLLRQWAEEGFARARGVPADPIAELRLATEHAAQAYQGRPQIEGREAA